MISLALQPLPKALLPAAVELDQAVLGGLWTVDGYRQELERPSSDLLGLWTVSGDEGSDSGLPDNGFQAAPSFVSLPRSSGLLFQSSNSLNPQILLGVGCGWSILDETHLVLLAVHPDFRQQGLGYAILLGLLTCAVNRGSNYATLEVRASNQAAIALYEKFGFKTAGRRPNYYTDVHSGIQEDALILWRSGLQSSEFKEQIAQRWELLKQQWTAQNWDIASPLPNRTETE